VTATKNAGGARLENSCDMEYNVFVNIERASVAHDGGVVTASAAKGEIEFAAAHGRGEGHKVAVTKNVRGTRMEKLAAWNTMFLRAKHGRAWHAKTAL